MDIRTGQGRPSDCEGRLAKEVECYDFLDSLGVEYLRADHPAAFDMETCDEVASALDTDICKNLFLCNRQETSFYLLMMPGKKKFKTKDISAQIQSARLSFANEQHMESLLGLTPGSVTVLGLLSDPDCRVRLLIDNDLVRDHATIGVHPAINTSSVRLSTRDLLDVVVPALAHTPTFVDLPWYTD